MYDGYHSSGTTTSTYKTTIPTNVGNGGYYTLGYAAILLVGTQFSYGSATSAGVYLLRRSNDGNVASVVKLSYESGDQRIVEPTFSISEDGYLQITHNGLLTYRSFG